jgi:hypothetical protein
VIRRCPATLTALVAGLAFGLGLQPTSAQADGISSGTTAGTAEYTLTTTTGLPTPTGPPPGTTATMTGAVSNGSAAVSLSSTSGLAVGEQVTGNGIPTGTTVTQINTNGTQVTLSQNATVTGSESLVFTSVPPPQAFAIIQPAGGVVTPPTTSMQGPLTILPGSSGFSQSGVYDYLKNATDSNGQPVQLFGLSFYGQGLASGGILNFSLNVTNASSPPQLVSQTNGVTITLDPASSQSSSSSSSGDANSEVPEPVSILLWSMLVGAGFLRARAAHRVAFDG